MAKSNRTHNQVSDPFLIQPLLIDKILEHAQKDPHRVAFTVLNEMGDVASALTYAQWVEKARRFGSELKKRGIEKEDRVILSLPTSEEFLVSFLGLWWIGAVAVPLPEPSPRIKKGSFHDRLIHVIADCTPKAIILPAKGKKLFLEVETLATELSHIENWEWSEISQSMLQLEASQVLEPTSADQDDIAFIQYTSGSTGIPKGVVVTHKTIRANSLSMGEASKMSSRDRILTWMPLYHDMGLVGGVLFPAYYQTHFFLIPTPIFLGNPKVWLISMSRHQITLSTSPNFIYNLCARRIKAEEIPNLDLSHWRLAYNGAEPIDAETLEAFQKKFAPFGFTEKTFYPVYGMAEATLAIAFPKPGSKIQTLEVSRSALEKGEVSDAKEDSPMVRFVSVGTALPHHQILIRDQKTREPLSDGKIGEICFSGPSVCPGYFRDQAWKTNPVEELATGDLGVLYQGQLYVVDRVKDLILIAGSNYYPSDIEREVHKVIGIRPGRSVAIGVPNRATGTSELVILSELSGDLNAETVEKEIRSRIYRSHGLVPRDIVLTREKKVPLTSSGKIMRKKCQELYLNGDYFKLGKKAA